MHGTHLEDLTTKIKPRAASSMLLWIIVAFVVALFVWSGFTELDRTVRGQGRVVTSSQLQQQVFRVPHISSTSISRQICVLRRQLGSYGSEITTVEGGYGLGLAD